MAKMDGIVALIDMAERRLAEAKGYAEKEDWMSVDAELQMAEERIREAMRKNLYKLTPLRNLGIE